MTLPSGGQGFRCAEYAAIDQPASVRLLFHEVMSCCLCTVRGCQQDPLGWLTTQHDDIKEGN